MADTTTTNLGLTKPEIGASADTWGTKLNANLDTIDSKFNASGQALSAVTTTGNAGTATALQTARTISLTGDVTGSATFNGSADASITATIAANSVALGTDTTGNYVADVTAGSYIVKSGVAGEGWSPTVAVDATSANTASKVVARDASGNFSAGTITATLSGNSSTATALQTARTINGTSFDGTANITITASTTNALTIGSYLTGGSFNGGSAVTVAVDATTAATASKVVARDASGYVFAAYYNSAGTFPVTASAGTTGMATFTGTNGTDNYGRGYTAAAAAALLSGQTMNINGSSTSCSGNAATATSATTATTATTANALNTANNYQVNSLGVGTAGSGTAGEIRATNNITAYYSDDRLKTKLGNIENALDKVDSLSGFYYEANEVAQSLGYEVKKEVGVSAQQVQAIMPEVVAPAPIDEKYLTVRYERLVPLLIEAIKELRSEVKALKGE